MTDQNQLLIKKQWFIQFKQGQIEDYYQLSKTKILGSGSYGSVIKAKLKDSKFYRAIKIIPKKKVKSKHRLIDQINIMKTLVFLIQQDHPNIIKLYQTFQDSRNIYLVMEQLYTYRLCEGGQVFDRILSKGFFSEKQARNIFNQLIQAVVYCHENKICHRDLKPENFLFLSKAQQSPIKVIDFGLARKFENQNDHPMKDKAGTVSFVQKSYYMAPQIFESRYNEKCDIWSLGVCLYVLLSGRPPFSGHNDQQIIEKVKLQKYTFESNEKFKNVSELAKNLISKCLVSQSKRITAKQILDHEWMIQQLRDDPLQCNFNSLKKFNNYSRLKKVALSYIASQLNQNQIMQLGKMFKSLDKNGDGYLTIDQIKEGLEKQGIKGAKQIQELIKSIDTDGNGKINYSQFIAASIDKNTYLIQQKLYYTFKLFDLDNSGKISKQQLKKVIGSNPSQSDDPSFRDKNDSYWQSIILEADKNGDGQIDYNEFIEMMSKLKIQ